MSNPKISVIIPVYNAESTLRRCVDSVLSQTFTDFECLLINDGSKDKSGEICDEYAAKDSRVRVFHKENGGVSSARNIGLDNMRGEWVSFVDSDDYIDSNYLKFMHDEAIRSDCSVVVCDFIEVKKASIRYCDAFDWSGNHPIDINTSSNSTLLNQAICYSTGVVWNTLISCALIKKHNLRFDITLKYGEDTLFILEVFANSPKLFHLKNALYTYDRRNETSAMNNITIEYSINQLYALLQLRDYLVKNDLLILTRDSIMCAVTNRCCDFIYHPEYYCLIRKSLGMYPKREILFCHFVTWKQSMALYLILTPFAFSVAIATCISKFASNAHLKRN